ncbi:MAG: hypothetical protein SD837_18545 [Candidatus Electrothrix scaldis]|nr:MAG: hypothetical protein SD837_18545 [Candidatus Electrothrix sp. GW3-3]
MSGNKIILGDNFETDGGKQYIAKDNATLTVNEGQQIPVEDLLKLLHEVKQELANLPVPKEVKEDVEHEVNGALQQAKRNPPNRKKIVTSLREATTLLLESSKTVKAAVAVGNMLGQGLVYCGEQWTNWAG